MLAQSCFGLLSPAGERARLSVFIFHRVLAEQDDLFPGELDANRFEAQLHWIGEWFNVLPLDEAIDRLKMGSLPARAAAITFDDGYSDNCTIALPILKRAGFSAAFFVASGYLNGGRMWNDTVIESIRKTQNPELDLTSLGLGRYETSSIEDRRRTIQRLIAELKYMAPDARNRLAEDMAAYCNIAPSMDLMLTSEQVRIMARSGMVIGGHTVSHPILACVDEQKARAEMVEGKEQLEAVLGAKVSLFAYPNGKPNADYTDEHVRIAREVGFSAAVSTHWGVATKRSDFFQIPRFTPWDRSKWRYAMRLATNMLRNTATTR